MTKKIKKEPLTKSKTASRAKVQPTSKSLNKAKAKTTTARTSLPKTLPPASKTKVKEKKSPTPKKQAKVKKIKAVKPSPLEISYKKSLVKGEIEQVTLPGGKHTEALIALFSDYYMTCILKKEDNTPAAFELQNAKKLLTMILDKDPLLQKKKTSEFKTLVTYFKPIFAKYQLDFPTDFYPQFRKIVMYLLFDSLGPINLSTSPLMEAIILLSLTGKPCKE